MNSTRACEHLRTQNKSLREATCTDYRLICTDYLYICTCSHCQSVWYRICTTDVQMYRCNLYSSRLCAADCAVAQLDTVHSGGRDATSAFVPSFLESLPLISIPNSQPGLAIRRAALAVAPGGANHYFTSELEGND